MKRFVMTAAGGLVLGLAVMFAAGPAVAQSPTHATLLAGRLTGYARAVLAGSKQPDEHQLALAGMLLEHVGELDPDNPETAYLRVEAAALKDDPAAVREVLTRYLKTRPRDDAAQLRLINLIADSAQTAQGRLALYQRMLEGKVGEQFSKPLRSRLAWQVALLHRELGDEQKFAESIKQAIELDETNAAATAEAYMLLVRRGAPAIDQAQALFSLLAADPTNPNVHTRVASTMLHNGAYEQALAWYQSANNIWQYTGAPADAQLINVLSEWALALCGLGQHEPTAKFIESFRKDQPEGRLPTSLLSILTATYDLSGQSDAADKTFLELLSHLQKATQQDSANPDPLADLIWAHVLFNRKLEDVPQLMEQLGELGDEDDARTQRLAGWLAMRQGDTEQATKLLEPLGGDDPAAALALAMMQPDDTSADQRRSLFNDVFARAPGTLPGIYAADHVRRLKGRPQPDDTAMTIQRLAQQIPEPVRRMARQAVSFVELELEAVDARPAFGQSLSLSVTLTNASPMPLSLGRGGTIPSTVLIMYTAAAGNQKPRPLPPHVIDIARRIRLSPGQSVTVKTTLDSVALQRVLDNVPQSVLLRPTAMLNPVLTRDGRYAPGLLGVISETKTISRQRLDPDAKLRSGGETAPHLLVMLTAQAGLLDAAHDADPVKLAGQLSDAFNRFAPTTQALMLTAVPRSEIAQKRYEPLLSQAAASDHPLVRQVLLLTRADSPDAAELTAALQAESPAVRTFAEHYQAVLKTRAEAIKRQQDQRKQQVPQKQDTPLPERK